MECKEQSANCEDNVLSKGIFNHIIHELSNFVPNLYLLFDKKLSAWLEHYSDINTWSSMKTNDKLEWSFQSESNI